MSNYHINTKCLHSGYFPKHGEPRVLPIVQSTTFCYDSASEMGDLFDLKKEGFFYTRISNPTTDAVEKKIADLEGGMGAMLTSSGQAATFLSIINICHAGDHIIVQSSIYGGTFNLFNKTIKEFGIDVTFIDVDITIEQIHKEIKENTRCIFIESLSNPSLVVADIEKFANIAHEHNIPLIVDNTFPTPINCRPIQFGADIIVHSTSKYMDGHALTIGGAIIDSGKFNWSNGKFKEFTKPDESYHGISYSDHFKSTAFISKARLHLMRDIGVTPSPNNCFLLNLGLETLSIRMERHCSNALVVAKYLKNNSKVLSVNYPGLINDKYFELAKKYMPNGSSGVIGFRVKGGRKAAEKFMNSMNLATRAVHVADIRTCILHPASTTHRQLSKFQLSKTGIYSDFLRLSVGIEHIDDILSDIENSLKCL